MSEWWCEATKRSRPQCAKLLYRRYTNRPSRTSWSGAINCKVICWGGLPRWESSQLLCRRSSTSSIVNPTPMRSASKLSQMLGNSLASSSRSAPNPRLTIRSIAFTLAWYFSNAVPIRLSPANSVWIFSCSLVESGRVNDASHDWWEKERCHESFTTRWQKTMVRSDGFKGSYKDHRSSLNPVRTREIFHMPGQSAGIRTQSPTLVVVTPLILRCPECFE